MAYDAELADRVREALPGEKALREVKMFGGLAFMVDEKMVACVSAGGGALLVRVSRGRDAEYLGVAGARRAEMGAGRSMGEGWIAVDRDALAEDDELRFWIDAVLEHHAEQAAAR
ncbi:Transcriptional regulator of competence genes, TfoX/Sxy family [Blastococcus sp. DSM 46786]|uniref:TfoX/Sxy family protein n=1 Tax=Blastococcus sp. DSM 46786 TaxID=1798227 RepID=UPI0008CDB3A5|nr:TfoX/Sxy family protein [Blastococcus sp. DSM 46786]SEK93414.1 Transcriptional regulator of competence genes, TfoX/Sxy family [Blastococcus sp. DSM 46786]